jgi:Histidine kinase/Histidine kinase-, DNA gyrase B-, and HSP90-like ATPase
MTPFSNAEPRADGLQAHLGARFAVRGLRSAGFGVIIAVCLTLAFGFSFRSTLAHSVCIAVASWFTIDLGRIAAVLWIHRNDPPPTTDSVSRWPGWPWMLPIILGGTIVGFSVGGSVGDWISGTDTPGFLRAGWREGLALLLLSLVPGVVITHWFYSRETIAAKEAAVQNAQRQAAEHQLKLLESQLEPHMLFNTLANLRVLIGVDPPRAQAMLDQLIAFLRATLGASRASSHPLGTEFARLNDYLALMQIRMGERLRTHFDLPDELAALPVPPLLLQPLVENSIKHGLEPNVAGGRIDVSARRDGEQLVLEVRDTGAGLSDTRSDGTQFGLLQVRERLATLYGARASFELVNAGGAEGGTRATLRLPLPHALPSP